MATPVKMPRLGESVAEGTVGAWLKQEGEYVEKDESLAEIITDKINAELPSPIAGKLSKILVHADETVVVGADIALIEESADVVGSVQAAPGPDAAPARTVEQTTRPVLDIVNGNSEGARASVEKQGMGREEEEDYLIDGLSGARTRLSGLLSEARTEFVADRNTETEFVGRLHEEERQRISPLARRLAKEHGVELSEISGTGAGGRVRKEDILAYVEERQAESKEAIYTVPVVHQQDESVISTSVQTPESVAGVDEELIVPSRMRLAIAEHMVRSKRTSPHATTVVEVDMTNIARWLEKNKEAFKKREGYGISYVPFVMKAVCEGIRKVPMMNSTWTADNKIVIKKRINLGIAVATEQGLVVPTIYDTDQYTLAGLARQVNILAQKARANKLTLQDMQNSTFVVNNPGVFGTIISMPIINQPHAGILSMDAVVKRAVVVEDDAIAVRSMMYIGLSFDHRILDGAGAGGFLQAVRGKLQSYGREIDIY